MVYSVIIPAAGQGKRMNAAGNKQFIHIRSIPLIVRTLQIFQHDDACRAIIVVVNAREATDMRELVTDYALTKVKALVPGGQERQESVYAGLQTIEETDGIVLVHDGARPFVRQEEIQSLISEVSDTQGAVLATKMKDTIKKGSCERLVTETLMRDELWAVQTPQAFKVKMLINAYENAKQKGLIGTDDASLVEQIGGAVRLIPGSEDNIKLTTPNDIGIAEMILDRRKEDRHENRARF